MTRWRLRHRPRGRAAMSAAARAAAAIACFSTARPPRVSSSATLIKAPFASSHRRPPTRRNSGRLGGAAAAGGDAARRRPLLPALGGGCRCPRQAPRPTVRRIRIALRAGAAAIPGSLRRTVPCLARRHWHPGAAEVGGGKALPAQLFVPCGGAARHHLHGRDAAPHDLPGLVAALVHLSSKSQGLRVPPTTHPSSCHPSCRPPTRAPPPRRRRAVARARSPAPSRASRRGSRHSACADADGTALASVRRRRRRVAVGEQSALRPMFKRRTATKTARGAHRRPEGEGARHAQGAAESAVTADPRQQPSTSPRSRRRRPPRPRARDAAALHLRRRAAATRAAHATRAPPPPRRFSVRQRAGDERWGAAERAAAQPGGRRVGRGVRDARDVRRGARAIAAKARGAAGNGRADLAAVPTVWTDLHLDDLPGFLLWEGAVWRTLTAAFPVLLSIFRYHARGSAGRARTTTRDAGGQ